MHWANSTVISLVIEVAGFLILLQGTILLMKAIKRLEKNFKKPLIFILASFLIYLILGIYVTIAIIMQFDFESFLWIIPFILGLFMALFLVFGGKRLLQEIEKS